MIYKKREWNKNKKNGFGHTVIDNFLDEETCLELYEECISAPKGGWTVFTRAGSRMEEFNDLISCPIAHQVSYEIMHSGEMLYDLEQLTGIEGLMPDPHLVGAGFSIFRNGTSYSLIKFKLSIYPLFFSSEKMKLVLKNRSRCLANAVSVFL